MIKRIVLVVLLTSVAVTFANNDGIYKFQEKSANDTNCMVLVTELKSDYWVGYEDYGYVIFELYGYAFMDKDDVICGNIRSYGFKDAYNATKEKNIRIYVEDYGLSKQSCIDWINSHDKWKD